MKRAFVRNRGLAFFIPGVLLLVIGILVIVSSPLNASVGVCLRQNVLLVMVAAFSAGCSFLQSTFLDTLPDVT